MSLSDNRGTFREERLVALTRRYYAKRNNGKWYRGALRITLNQLRDERGTSHK